MSSIERTGVSEILSSGNSSQEGSSHLKPGVDSTGSFRSSASKEKQKGTARQNNQRLQQQYLKGATCLNEVFKVVYVVYLQKSAILS